MWWLINLLVLGAGFSLLYVGWREGQHAEAYGALFYFFIGLVLTIIGIFSSIIKVVWFSS